MTGLPGKPKPRTYLAWRINRENIDEVADHIGAQNYEENGKIYLAFSPTDPLPAEEGEWVVASEDGEDATVYGNDEFQRIYTTA